MTKIDELIEGYDLADNIKWCLLRLKATLKNEPAVYCDVIEIIQTYEAANAREAISELKAERDRLREALHAIRYIEAGEDLAAVHLLADKALGGNDD
jgi:hypothetical protein